MRSIITTLRAGRITSRGVLTSDGSPFLNCGVLMGDSVLMADGVVAGDLHAPVGRATNVGLDVRSFSNAGVARNAAHRHRPRALGGGNSSRTAAVTAAPPR